MEKAGLLQGRASQPQKCPGERRKMKPGSGNERLVVSCSGISGLFSQEQSHPCCLSSNSWAGEMSQAAGNDWGRRKFVTREGISWLFTRAVETLERMESPHCCPCQGREDVPEPSSPEQQKSVLMKDQDWLCWKNLTFICHWSDIMICGRFCTSSSSLSPQETSLGIWL